MLCLLYNVFLSIRSNPLGISEIPGSPVLEYKKRLLAGPCLKGEVEQEFREQQAPENGIPNAAVPLGGRS